VTRRLKKLPNFQKEAHSQNLQKYLQKKSRFCFITQGSIHQMIGKNVYSFEKVSKTVAQPKKYIKAQFEILCHLHYTTFESTFETGY
jgi:hypothetical protein